MALLEGSQALRPLGTNAIQFGSTATVSSFTIGSGLLRIETSAAVCFTLDGTVAATASGIPMSADQTEYFLAQGFLGNTIGVKARDSAATGVIGTLWVTECGF